MSRPTADGKQGAPRARKAACDSWGHPVAGWPWGGIRCPCGSEVPWLNGSEGGYFGLVDRTVRGGDGTL